MFKKLVAIFLALGMLIVPIPIKVMAATETDGFLVPVTQKDTVPYGYTGIYTAEDFNNIRENLSGQYILMNDIDLSLFQSWNPIGENEKEEFCGVLDGNGFSILNMNISYNQITDSEFDSDVSIGLFGCIGKNAEIKNLYIKNSEISVSDKRKEDSLGELKVGILVGSAMQAKEIKNCVVDGVINIYRTNINVIVGGIIGAQKSSELSDLKNIARININESDCKNSYIGGISGNGFGNIKNVYNYGDISCTFNTYIITVGGIIGEYSGSELVSGFNSGNIETYANSDIAKIGGIIGNLDRSSALSKVYGCINMGNVTSYVTTSKGTEYNYTGGIIGQSKNYLTSISNSANVGKITAHLENNYKTTIPNDAISNYSYSEAKGIGKGIITDCYNSGDIYSYSKKLTLPEHAIACAGGISAYCLGTGTLDINNSYNVGKVLAYDENNTYIIDGIVGINYGNQKRDFNLKNIYCLNEIESEFAISLDRDSMAKQRSFDGFDFESIWSMGSGKYPYPILNANINFDLPLTTVKIAMSADKYNLSNDYDIVKVSWVPDNYVYRYYLYALSSDGTYLTKGKIFDDIDNETYFCGSDVGMGTTLEIWVIAVDENGLEFGESNHIKVSYSTSIVEKLTKNSLKYTDKDTKENINNSIYNLLFKAEFRPDTNKVDDTDFGYWNGSEQTTQKGVNVNYWPARNRKPNVSRIYDKGLDETIKFNNGYYSASGCMAYAYFVSSYVYGTARERSFDRYCEDKTTEGIKQLIEDYADPGEQIRVTKVVKPYTYAHSLIYLGEDDNGDGFYYLDYGDNGGKNPTIGLRYYTYIDFFNTYKSYDMWVFDVNGGSYYNNTAKSAADLRRDKGLTDIRGKLECPVELKITLDNMIMDSSKINDGEEIEEYYGNIKREGETIKFDLEYNPDYTFEINGTDEGEMTLTLEYYSDDELIETRKFVSVPITKDTIIKAGPSDPTYSYVLSVDDGKDENYIIWDAGFNETVYESNSMLNAECDKDSENGEKNDNSYDKKQTPPSAPKLESRTKTSITLKKIKDNENGAKAEYRIDGGKWQSSNVFKELEPDTKYVFEARYAAVDNFEASEPSESAKISTAKKSSGGSGSSYTLDKVENSNSNTNKNDKPETKPEKTKKSIFADVSLDNPNYDAIVKAYEKGYMVGTSENTFAPDGFLTRGMAAQIIWNIAGNPEPSGVSPFLDVTSDMYYAKAVAWAYERGIVLGYDITKFGPDDFVTIEQFDIMMAKYNSEAAAPYTGVSPNATRGYVASRIAL